MDAVVEQAAFEAWLGSLGRAFVRRNASNWLGSAETKPTYCASWVEAQWMGWQARAALGGVVPADLDRICGAICAGKVRDCLECSPGRCAVRKLPN